MVGGEVRTVYVSGEDGKRSAGWRIGSYEERGILSGDEKAALVAGFGLTAELVDELSVAVGNSLDRESIVELLPVSAAKAAAKGQKALEEAARLARRIQRDQERLKTLLAGLSCDFDESRTAAVEKNAIEASLATITPAVEGLEDPIDRLKAIPNGVAELTPDDKRAVRDKRRTHVVWSCCYVWRESGREISYTSVPHETGNRARGGALIDFIQTVISFVTEPSSEAPVSSILRDLKLFEARRAAGLP